MITKNCFALMMFLFTKGLAVQSTDKGVQAILNERACEHTDLIIRCGEGTVIAIVSANYGRYSKSFCPSYRIFTSNCSAQSSMDKVKEACNNQRSCTVKASNEVFGDPCEGTFKYLEVEYYCKAKMNERACEHTDLKLRCGKGTVISIVSANYGRYSRSFCPSYRIFTSNCSAQSSMDKVKQACNDQQTCTVKASNEVFGDPCEGTFKYLEVGYYCKVLMNARACEHTDLKLGCEEGKLIAILGANYGRYSRAFCPSYRIFTSNCSAQSSLDKVKEACDNQQTCTVKASNEIFGDPCKGTFKYLEVGYYCKAAMNERACEHTDLKLNCGTGKVIAILSANYGRYSRSFCPSYKIFTSNCAAESSMEKVKEACNNQQTCTVTASNEVFGDPCKGTFKYLEVGYYCKVAECNKPCGLNAHCLNQKCVCKKGCEGKPEIGCRCRCSNGGHLCAYGAYCENKQCKCYPGREGDGKKYCDEMCVCRVSGDPHVHTYDYQIINFQGICKYTLSKLIVINDECSFNVEIKNEHRRGNKRVSYVRLVDFEIYGVRIRLHKKDVKVNGIEIPYTKENTTFLGGKIVLRRTTIVEVITQCGIGVSFKESHAKVIVKVPRKYQNQLTGICGNCDGIKNDLRTKNGDKMNDFSAIVHSYLVNDDSDKPNPKCKE